MEWLLFWVMVKLMQFVLNEFDQVRFLCFDPSIENQKMKFKLLVLLGISILASCSSNDLEPNSNALVPKKKEVEVFVAGYGQYAGTSPALWKNGSLELLPPYSWLHTSVGNITASGSDVYIVGTMDATPVFWKNSTLNVIPIPFASSATVSEIAVSVTDVYVAGVLHFSADFYSGDTLAYWKNGIYKPIASSTNQIEATGIAVSGEDVFVTGNLIDNIIYNRSAVYWKNGVKTTLASDARTTGLALHGSDIYISGVTYEGGSFFSCYWKNGELFPLEGWSSQSTGISVSGSDVYVSGFSPTVSGYGTYAVYWKNGKMTQLTESTTYANAIATDVVASGSDIYVSGSKLDLNTYEWDALYWKNGVAKPLGKGHASAICIK